MSWQLSGLTSGLPCLKLMSIASLRLYILLSMHLRMLLCRHRHHGLTLCRLAAIDGQQQLVSDLQKFVNSQVSKFQDRQKLQTAVASLQARYQGKLQQCGDDVSSIDMVWLQNHNNRSASLKAHLEQVSQELGMTDDHKKKETRTLSVPKGFENGKGEALISKVHSLILVRWR